MKTISKLTLAAVLATGVSGVALTTPAFAKDKKEEKAPGLKLSPGVIKVANPARDALNANNLAVAEPLVVQVETEAKTPDDQYIASTMRYMLEARKLQAQQQTTGKAGDESVLVKPLDALIANPSTPAADKAKFYFQRGAMAYNGKQYPIAVQYLTKSREMGFRDPQLDLVIVKAKVDGGDVSGGMNELSQLIAASTAKGEKAPDEYYRYAIARSNRSHLKPQTLEWLRKYAAAYPSPKTWYEVLATYGFQQDSVEKLDNQQKLDLLRLMRATGGLTDQYFYVEYAQKAQNLGLPLEAQAVLKEGMANGKIPAANTEAKALMGETALAIRNEGSLATLETKARAGANGSLAMQTADANLGSGNYAKAVELYRLALQKGGVDANVVNTRLGIALARSGDKAGAKAAFAQVTGGSRADIAGFWTTYLDQAA